MQIIKNNWIYFLYCGVYFVLAWFLMGFKIDGFIMTAFLYAVSLCIAFSPLGEWILRKINKVRSLKTQQEITKLMPIFEEVYSNALKKNNRLKKDIQLYIAEGITVNAFAIGRGTIAITEGALETLDEKEIRGILAHEFGHMANGDTKALLISVVGNGVFSLSILLIKGILWVLEFILKQTKTGAHLLVNGLQFVFGIITFVLLYIGQVILSINSRQNEYRADNYALEIGYGGEMVDVLYFLQKFNIGHKPTAQEKMMNSHPHIADRIKILESQL